MLAYNGGKDALDAIGSLRSQRHLVESVFISDNASTDNTGELLREQADSLGFTHLSPPENLGFAAGFNLLFETALQKSSAEYFLVLNNDTEAEELFLEHLLKEASPTRIVSPMILWHRDKKTVIQCAGNFDKRMIKMDNHFARMEKTGVPPGVHRVEQTDGCCFLIHRSWIEKGYRFNPDLFIYFEDVDLFLRLSQAGATFHYVTNSVLYHGVRSQRRQGKALALPQLLFLPESVLHCQSTPPGPQKVASLLEALATGLGEGPGDPLRSPRGRQGYFAGHFGFLQGKDGEEPYSLISREALIP